MVTCVYFTVNLAVVGSDVVGTEKMVNSEEEAFLII